MNTSANIVSSPNLLKARECLQRGIPMMQSGSFSEAIGWLEASIRHLNTEDARKSEDKPTLELECLLALAHSHLQNTNPDTLAALKAATSALDLVPDHPSAMFMRAIAFAIPSPWQSRSRFDAELERISTLYPNDPSLPTLRAIKDRQLVNKAGELSYPPDSSDATFGLVAVAAEEGEQEAKAKQSQQRLFDQLGLRFSTHLSEELYQSYATTVRSRQIAHFEKESFTVNAGELYSTNKDRAKMQNASSQKKNVTLVPLPYSAIREEASSDSEIRANRALSWFDYICICSQKENKQRHQD